MRPTSLAVTVFALVLAVTGCLAPRGVAGEGPLPGPGPEPTALPGPRPVEDARAVAAPEETVAAYADALAGVEDPERMREGLRHTVEGSTAHTYLAHQTAVAQAWTDEGRPAPGFEAERTADGYRLCPGGEPTPEAACVVYGGFTARNGRLTGMLVDGRDPGPGLVAADGTEAGSEGVFARLLTAYRSADDEFLAVTVELSTEEAASLDLLQASYGEGGAEPRRAREAVGRSELDAGEATHAVFFFSEADPGGTLRVGGCLEECSVPVDIELPVR